MTNDIYHCESPSDCVWLHLALIISDKFNIISIFYEEILVSHILIDIHSNSQHSHEVLGVKT